MQTARYRIKSLGACLGLVLALADPGRAWAAENETPPAAPLNCRDTGSFVPPTIPWMGDFTYKVSIDAQQGRTSAVNIETLRGPDTRSNSHVVSTLAEHIRRHYVCDGEGTSTEFYLKVNFKHDKLEGLAAHQKVLLDSIQSAAARAASATQANQAAGTLEPVRAALICTAMGKPNVPRVNAVGTLELSALSLVTDGKVTALDIKLLVGSKDQALNQKFIDVVERTLRDTYVCPGNHVFEQRFRFKMS